MKRKPKVGDVVAIYMRDHSRNEPNDELLSFIVYGRVAVVTSESITVDSWANEDPDKKRIPDDEVETVTLLWAAVTKLVQLEEVNE